MIKITSVVAKENYKLLVTFSNGKSGVFDVEPYLNGGIFKDLRDNSLFRSVRVADATIEWANGADLCPDCVYLETSFI